jgi:hypothetical protein
VTGHKFNKSSGHAQPRVLSFQTPHSIPIEYVHVKTLLDVSVVAGHSGCGPFYALSNVYSAHNTLMQLCSSHSSNSDRSSALSSLEHMLATICVPEGSESTAEFEAFLASQDAFECNSALLCTLIIVQCLTPHVSPVPSRIISWISSAVVGLETIINKSPSDRK